MNGIMFFILSHVAQINIYITDVDAFRAADAATRLASPEYRVEIEAIAVLP